MLPSQLVSVLTDAGLKPQVDGIDSVTVTTPHFTLSFEHHDWLRAQATWVGAMNTHDYVRSIVAINSAHNHSPIPRMVVDSRAGLANVLKKDEGDIQVHATLGVPVGEGLTESQISGFVAAAFDSAIELTREFHALYPERSPQQRGATINLSVRDASAESQVTPVRVANWFMDQGVDEVPYDASSGRISFELDSVPVDIVLDNSDLLQIVAVVPIDHNVEATEVLHLCNRANLDSAHSTIFMRSVGDGVECVATVVLPIRAGLDDIQLSQALSDGVVGVVGQVKAVIGQLH
ncbi:hypothetical protein CDES_06200 [Corynebacterium deserti GIMN1.010]|uniref:YbjN domain-containing protein n=1 Tax=Corynebacterium deserti GIMN1.010 TaxID=931089 RepID=A0A0M5IU08_9CORY|nr:YbjN domain-containing protein [Corynebacterium deserti]ALC05668.1 hypothetical protein CDES_06200 [Corynebacterium deserti GIMN1.010]